MSKQDGPEEYISHKYVNAMHYFDILQVLQSLGKTGKTTDEQLHEDSLRLEKQQVSTERSSDVSELKLP